MNDVVRQMAAQRHEVAARPMSLLEAVELAKRVRAMPEVLVDCQEAKEAMKLLLGAIERSQCFFKATLKGEDVFVLRQPDRAAPATIRFWATLAEANGCGKGKVADAFATAIRWQQQPDTATKWPD